MKALVLTILLLLALNDGEALQCNHCVPSTPGSGCSTTVQTCSFGNDACIRAVFLPPATPSYFRRCISRYDCQMLQNTPGMDVYCCYTDRCN